MSPAAAALILGLKERRLPQNRQIGLLAAAFAAAAAAVLLVAGWQWRVGKVSLLQPTEQLLPARPDAGNATGGVLLFGDSRVAQWSPLPERDFPIVRHGHPGETAIRLPATFEAALDRHSPRLVLLQAGVNDATAAALLPAEQQAGALAASEAAFDRMAQAAAARGIPLVILTPIPPVRPGLPRKLAARGALMPWLATLSARLPAIADRHGATLVDPLPLLAPSAAEMPEAYRADALHLTPAAYGRLNALVPETLPLEPVRRPAPPPPG